MSDYACPFCNWNEKTMREECDITHEPTNGAVMCHYEFENCQHYNEYFSIGRKNKHGNFKCSNCGSFNVHLHVTDDLISSDSNAGKLSGFHYSVGLCCYECGRYFPVCKIKHPRDISSIKYEFVHSDEEQIK